MGTASDTAGQPEGKSGAKTSSQADGSARPGAAGTGKSRTRKAAGAASSSTEPDHAGQPPASPPAGQKPPAGSIQSPKASGDGGDEPPPPGDGGGSGPPTDGSPARGGPAPWPRVALYGLAGLAGGALVAAILLLTDINGGVRHDAVAPESGELAEMRQRIEELSGQLTSLQPAPQERPALTPGDAGLAADGVQAELARLDERLLQLAGETARAATRLEGRIAALEAQVPEDLRGLLGRTAERQTVETLQQRVARLELDEVTRDVRQAALSLALAHLTRATETSKPFVNELKALEVLDTGTEAVAALRPYAETGLPSVPTLANRFEDVADDVVSAHRRAHGRGFLERLWDSIAGLFRVRPVGEVEGEKAPAIVARAEQRLEEGELALAVEQLERLGEPEAAAASQWLEAARARLRLDNLVTDVNRDVLAGIAEAEAERRAREQNIVPAEPAPEEPSADAAPADKPAAGPETDGQGASRTEGEAETGASER